MSFAKAHCKATVSAQTGLYSKRYIYNDLWMASFTLSGNGLIYCPITSRDHCTCTISHKCCCFYLLLTLYHWKCLHLLWHIHILRCIFSFPPDYLHLRIISIRTLQFREACVTLRSGPNMSIPLISLFLQVIVSTMEVLPVMLFFTITTVWHKRKYTRLDRWERRDRCDRLQRERVLGQITMYKYCFSSFHRWH